MKKLILLVVVLAIGGFVAYKFFGKEKSEPRAEKPKPLSLGEQTTAFHQSFETLLAAYFEMKDAFVEGDTLKVNAAAAKLASASETLKVDEIAGDSTGIIKETAKTYTGTIAGSAVGLAGEQDIENKRKELDMITDAVWTLTRTVKYEGQKIYYQKCPMAFENKGAYWLSKETAIRNPYFGKKMLTCGQTEDSLQYKN